MVGVVFHWGGSQSPSPRWRQRNGRVERLPGRLAIPEAGDGATNICLDAACVQPFFGILQLRLRQGAILQIGGREKHAGVHVGTPDDLDDTFLWQQFKLAHVSDQSPAHGADLKEVAALGTEQDC